MTKKSFVSALSKLRQFGYSRILFNTVVCGDLVKIAKDEGYKVVSLIHELAKVVKMLSCEHNTEEMIKYSDRTVFSTNVAKKEILNLLGIYDNPSILTKPQGLYYKTPSEKIINGEINNLKSKYPIDNYAGVVIGVGNTTERKGFDLFVETAAQLPDILFFWAGKKESYYDTVLKQNENRFPDNFIFLGVLNSQELAGLYSVASVLLIDAIPSNPKKSKRFHKKFILYRAFILSYATRFDQLKICPKMFIKIVLSLITRIIGINRFLDIFERNVRKYNEHNTGKYSTVCWQNVLGGDMSDEDILSPVEIEFEGHMFYVPKNYDRYLSSLYGDYMTPLPEDKRKNHYMKAYYK